MSYKVDRYQNNNFEPNWPAEVAEGSINATSTSLKIPGRGIPNYGELIAENFVHILENFAGPTEPLNPITGQLWYDTSVLNKGVGSLKIFNGLSFVRVSGVDIDNTPFFNNSSSGKRGDIRYYLEEGKKSLFIHDGTSWNYVSGVLLSSSDPSNTLGNDGDLYYNTSSENIFVKANGTWLNLLVTKIPQSSNNGFFSVDLDSSNNIGILTSENNIIAIFSYSVIPVSLLPVSFVLPNGNSVNLQTLFPNGLKRGLNFSNLASNSIIVNPQSSDNFTIEALSGNLRLKGSNNNLIELANNGRININKQTFFTTNDHIKLPEGTTSQRPSSPENGSFRLNSSNNSIEYYNNGFWYTIVDSSNVFSFLTSSVIPSGTVMLFYQNAAPPGWTQVTGLNNSLIRIVDTGGGTNNLTGNNFTDIFKIHNINFAGQSTDGHKLTISEMPVHGHPFRLSVSRQITAETSTSGGFSMWKNANFNQPSWLGPPESETGRQIGAEGGDQAHSHTLNNVNYPLNLNIKYINVIVAQKN